MPAVLADYGFEYSDDDQQEEDVDIENQYYNSKGTLCATTAVTQRTHAAAGCSEVWVAPWVVRFPQATHSRS